MTTKRANCICENKKKEPCGANVVHYLGDSKETGLCTAHLKKLKAEGRIADDGSLILNQVEGGPDPDADDEPQAPAIGGTAPDPDDDVAGDDDDDAGEDDDDDDVPAVGKTFSFPSKTACPKCKGVDSIVRNTNGKMGRQYKLCLSLLFERDERGFPKGPFCPRCGFKHVRLAVVTKRNAGRDSEGRIFTTARCGHPALCRNAKPFQVELCGHKYSVDGEEI